MSQYTRRLAMLWSLFVLMLLASGSHSAYAQNAALKLALDWYPNANHLGLFIAQEKGYFRQENLDGDAVYPGRSVHRAADGRQRHR